jgi:ribosomal protein L32
VAYYLSVPEQDGAVLMRALNFPAFSAILGINIRIIQGLRSIFSMGKPKKRTSPRKTGLRRSHLVLELARAVNAKSPVKAYTTRKESTKKAA